MPERKIIPPEMRGNISPFTIARWRATGLLPSEVTPEKVIAGVLRSDPQEAGVATKARNIAEALRAAGLIHGA